MLYTTAPQPEYYYLISQMKALCALHNCGKTFMQKNNYSRHKDAVKELKNYLKKNRQQLKLKNVAAEIKFSKD
uniref:C2H2-type domain-containing protein n=1 Tax=Romanomermis culicivorax TaxID=13658 RepID=A0A915KIS5_ROMCU